MKEQTKSTYEELTKKADTLSLGGNIQLKGFQSIEKAKQIVAKKIIGNYVKQIQEKKTDYERLVITLEKNENNTKIKAELTAGGNTTATEDTKDNMFVALDVALKKVLKQA